MGYTNIGVRVIVDALGPMYIIPGKIAWQHPINLRGISTGCGNTLACG